MEAFRFWLLFPCLYYVANELVVQTIVVETSYGTRRNSVESTLTAPLNDDLLVIVIFLMD